MRTVSRVRIGLGSLALFVLWVAARSTTNCYAGNSAAFIGRASCASATCHGGISGQGPAWNSSLRTWEATDLQHVGAGNVLLNDKSKQIVAALVGRSLNAATYRTSLSERCVSCHAPNLVKSQSPETVSDAEWRRQIQEGVDCEACHGPASKWLDLHTLQAADGRLASQENGKMPTQPWLDRTDNCLRCHLGSRPPGGTVRDLNHDLIAAGHPALRFEMSLYHANLPAHWAVAQDQLFSSEPFDADVELATSRQPPAVVFEFPTPQQHHLSRLRTIAATASLSQARLDASRRGLAPWPEFAEYNCFACHQNLELVTNNLDRMPQKLTWNPMVNQHSLLGNHSLLIDRRKLPMWDKTFEARLVTLASTAEDCIVDTQLKPVDPIAAWRAAADDQINVEQRLDYNLAASWLWTNRLMIRNLSAARFPKKLNEPPGLRLSASQTEELDRLLDAFAMGLNSLAIAAVYPQFRYGSEPVRSALDTQLKHSHTELETANQLTDLRDTYRSRLHNALTTAEATQTNGALP